jgi:hypothetical protein
MHHCSCCAAWPCPARFTAHCTGNQSTTTPVTVAAATPLQGCSVRISHQPRVALVTECSLAAPAPALVGHWFRRCYLCSTALPCMQGMKEAGKKHLRGSGALHSRGHDGGFAALEGSDDDGEGAHARMPAAPPCPQCKAPETCPAAPMEPTQPAAASPRRKNAAAAAAAKRRSSMHALQAPRHRRCKQGAVAHGVG